MIEFGIFFHEVTQEAGKAMNNSALPRYAKNIPERDDATNKELRGE